ncbi:hypothetical protein K6119_07545 [Paracrocinitomix mangrovi]|uniref:hypothetical protein n=1 Tax=Paracrocinitomix mangrovi TaxID=2862509 RepID=UPI001C8D9966|nr:hypothetical protein [Paracrocinitomix mangrovi]UKN03368.1 hypothetical protein K6119_07545 [Paracrocinitomix mangrovi]
MLLFAFITPMMADDVREVMKYDQKVIYLGILGFITILADTFGSILKSKQLREDYYRSTRTKAIGRYFVIFWIFRAAVMSFGAMIAVRSFIGDQDPKEVPWAMTIVVIEALRWLVMGFVIFYSMSEGKRVDVSNRSIFIGDVLIMFSSLFYLTAMWISIAFKYKLSELNKSELAEHFIAGFVLFLMIYVPATFYQTLESFVRSNKSSEKWLFWLGIVFTGMAALTLPYI